MNRTFWTLAGIVIVITLMIWQWENIGIIVVLLGGFGVFCHCMIPGKDNDVSSKREIVARIFHISPNEDTHRGGWNDSAKK